MEETMDLDEYFLEDLFIIDTDGEWWESEE